MITIPDRLESILCQKPFAVLIANLNILNFLKHLNYLICFYSYINMFIHSSHCSLPFIITFCFIYVIISLNPPQTLTSPQSFINNSTATRQHGHLNTVPLAYFLTSTQKRLFPKSYTFFFSFFFLVTLQPTQDHQLLFLQHSLSAP